MWSNALKSIATSALVKPSVFGIATLRLADTNFNCASIRSVGGPSAFCHSYGAVY